MLEHWTPEEIQAYARAIKLYPKQKARQKEKRQRELDNLFEWLHGNQRECSNKQKGK